MFIKFYKCVKIENITIFTNNLYLEISHLKYLVQIYKKIK